MPKWEIVQVKYFHGVIEAETKEEALRLAEEECYDAGFEPGDGQNNFRAYKAKRQKRG